MLKEFALFFTSKTERRLDTMSLLLKQKIPSDVSMFGFKLHYVREKCYFMRLTGRITINQKRNEEKYLF